MTDFVAAIDQGTTGSKAFTLIERLPRPIPTDHGPSDPVIRVGGVWRRTSDIESSELVAALRVCPSMARPSSRWIRLFSCNR